MRHALITDDTVKELYGKKLFSSLKGQGYDIALFSFPAGELSKTRATKEKLEDELLNAGYSRDTTILALGGGVVTDLVGFLASTYCRGVDLVLIPTTLLAMVDASMGGKTGVNTPHAKNMIGTFYEPVKTIIDLSFLATLSEKEMFNGKVEMLKAGLIADPEFFYEFSLIPLEKAIDRAREIKKEIVEADRFEKGKRRSLNLGHTLGHAFETVSNYQISHGEAVAAGIVLEARIAHALGMLDKSVLDVIEERFPPVKMDLEPDAVIKTLKLDKKGRFVLLQDIGTVVDDDVPQNILEKILNDAALCSC